MSNDPSFRCPVCRATQTMRERCRRCGADLDLVVRARRRVAYLMAQRDQAIRQGDSLREHAIRTELRSLIREN